MKQRRSLFLFVGAIALLAAVWSSLILATPKQQTLDQRVHSIASQLRCPVCQGESVADSPSALALQMRGVIRQQVQAGKSDQDVIQYFENRYGASIVWSPPWQGYSLLAWFVPIGLLLGGCALLFFVLREWRSTSSTTNARAPVTEDKKSEDADLEPYRKQLEQELAADDVLFRGYRTEAN